MDISLKSRIMVAQDPFQKSGFKFSIESAENYVLRWFRVRVIKVLKFPQNMPLYELGRAWQAMGGHAFHDFRAGHYNFVPLGKMSAGPTCTHASYMFTCTYAC